MKTSLFPAVIFALAAGCLVSCAHVSKRMPDRLERMDALLSRDNPGECYTYHYNFERQVPGMYDCGRPDSILDVIEYIKTECGPGNDLETARLLLLADSGQFDDSLIGSFIIPQMLWYRSEQEYLLDRMQFASLYGGSQPMDNTHDRFDRFITDLGRKVSADSAVPAQAQAIGQFYGGAFDSGFSRIQSDEFRGTALREEYDEYVARTRRMFPTRMDAGLIIGSWRPQGHNRLLGNHPDIGIQYGTEGRLWRVDGTFCYRFSSAKNSYEVDSLGQIVSTNEFSSLMLGLDAGIKLFDNPVFSTDIFGGAGYDVIYSVSEAGDPEKTVKHGSWAASIGLRHRFFLNQSEGLYAGGIIRYSLLDYSNPGGTDLSGNTLTIGLVMGISFHATLQQFFDKLNYKGSRRP
jgi:hypothetical protein